MKKAIILIVIGIIVVGGIFGVMTVKDKAESYKAVYDKLSEEGVTAEDIEAEMEKQGISKEDVQSVLEDEEAVSDLKDMGISDDTVEGLKDLDPEAIDKAKGELSGVDKSELMKFAAKYGGDLMK